MVNTGKNFERKELGAAVAKCLIDIKAINFRPQDPYKLTSGWASPVYIDCRKVIAHLPQRRTIIKMAVDLITREISNPIDMVAGGETAGIPYAAWISEALSKPMLYVRKKPKGFARMAQIEGDMPQSSSVLLVEDLATDGGSKITFVEALRKAGGMVTDVFVVFYYSAFPGAEANMAKAGVRMHYLCDWWNVIEVAESGGFFTTKEIDDVKEFLDDPLGWSATHGGK